VQREKRYWASLVQYVHLALVPWPVPHVPRPSGRCSLLTAQWPGVARMRHKYKGEVEQSGTRPYYCACSGG
jgi:hypothetical protein